MKKVLKQLLALILATCCAIPAIPSITSHAEKTVTGVETGFACKSGKYIYYAFEMDGVRMDLMRLDTKTGKKKKIVSNLYKGQQTNGFHNITAKGKYIYACWDLENGTDCSKSYIYRFSKDGKSKKRLASGMRPVIIKNRIYYEKYIGSTRKTYSMKLNGSDKKECSFKLKKRITAFDYSSETVPTLKIGNYKYYVGNNNKTLYRYNIKTKKKNKIITYPAGDGIREFMIIGNYAVLKGYKRSKTYNFSSFYFITYCVKTNGKNKTKLKSWVAGE